jgi:hypothetical protein
MDTTRKSINTNRNIEGISLSVNFQGILPKGIFPLYIPRELQWKKIKTKLKKKQWRVIYSVGKIIGKLWILFIMSIIKGIINKKFCWYFPESSETVHFPTALLIVVLCRQNHRRIEKSSVLFDGFLKKFN